MLATRRIAQRLRSTRLGRRVRARLYAGGGVECPCCGGRFRRFAPYGVSPRRPFAQCPGCGAMERHRHLWLFLGERTDLLARPQRLLHFAPEAVFREQLRARHGLGYVTADLKASRGDVRADITRIPFAEGSFDAVLCNHVFEHVPDDVAAMGQIRRVLRPGGWAVLQVPLRSRLAVTQEDPGVTDPRDRERLYGQHDHLRQYGRDYEERLQMAGFLVEAERFGDTLPVERQQRHGLKSETIYLCRRATER